MANGLAALGDVLQQGSRDYLNIRRTDERNAELRQQQLDDEQRRRGNALDDEQRRRGNALDDEQRQRGYTKEDRADARSYEESRYDKRRWDNIKEELVKKGYLSRDVIGTPAEAEAFQAATNLLNRNEGAEAVRIINELATYKASLPALLLQAGEVDGADKFSSYGVGDIEQAREFWGRLNAKLGTESQGKKKRELDNAKNMALTVAKSEADLSRIQSDLANAQDEGEAIANMEVPIEVNARLQAEILSANPALAKNPKSYAEELSKKKGDYLLKAGYENQKRITALNRQLQSSMSMGRNIAALGDKGAYAFMPDAEKKLAEEPGVTPGATPKGKVTQPATGSPAASNKVPDTYTPLGAGAAAAKGGAVPTVSAVSAIPNNLLADPSGNANQVIPSGDVTAEPTVLPANQPPSKPKWWSVDRDPEANQQAVINAAKKAISGAGALAVLPYDIAKGAAQRLNPANTVPGYLAGSDAWYAFDPYQAAILRDRKLPRRLPDVAPDGTLFYPQQSSSGTELPLRRN